MNFDYTGKLLTLTKLGYDFFLRNRSRALTDPLVGVCGMLSPFNEGFNSVINVVRFMSNYYSESEVRLAIRRALEAGYIEVWDDEVSVIKHLREI